ncbi:MAG: hypothetical protein HC915_17910, partial [Anaerolineae bacterium]|nr:hypothetical protein [Anaerolineae bacterium]
MSFKVLPKGALKTWVQRFQERGFRVVAPKAFNGSFVFDEIQNAEEMVVEYPTTVLPPKKYLLPQREELFRFNTRTMEMQPAIDAQPTIILGMHTCDLHATVLLDEVNNNGFVDQHYKARRDETYLISIECHTPCTPNSFCKCMGTLTTPEKFDVHLV